jgi:hypothetical protein
MGRFASQIKKVSFYCFTEYKRSDQMYRAHPNSSKCDQWDDCSYVEFALNIPVSMATSFQLRFDALLI